MQYLKNKYNEEFEFESMDASWNEGNLWTYRLYAIPKNNPDIKVLVESKPGLKNIKDYYKRYKWNIVRKEQIKDLIEKEFGNEVKYDVIFFVTDEVDNRYYINTEPLDIVNKEPIYKKDTNNNRLVKESLDVYIPIDENINEDEVIKNIIGLIKYYNDLHLYCDIDLIYGKKKINGESNIKSDGTFENIFAKVELYSDMPIDNKTIRKYIQYR